MQIARDVANTVTKLNRMIKVISISSVVINYLLWPCMIIGFAILPAKFTFIHGLILLMMLHKFTLEYIFKLKLSKYRTIFQATCVMNGIIVAYYIFQYGMTFTLLPINIPLLVIAFWCIIGHGMYFYYNTLYGKLLYNSNIVGQAFLRDVIDKTSTKLIEIYNDTEMDVEEKRNTTIYHENLRTSYQKSLEILKKRF